MTVDWLSFALGAVCGWSLGSALTWLFLLVAGVDLLELLRFTFGPREDRRG